MKLKTLIVTILILAALSTGAFLARRPEAPPSLDARLNQPLVDRATIEKSTKLRLSDAGKTVELIRQADGTWRVPSYYDMSADFTKLSGFVGNLTEAKLQRLVTTSADRIARLEFKDTKIELIDATDKPVMTLTLGKNAEVGGGRYVKIGDEKKAFLTNLTAYLDTEPKTWANPELINIKADDVAKIEVAFAEGPPVNVVRSKKDDPWVAANPVAGQKIKADKIATLLSSIGNLRFSETNGTDDPLATAAKSNSRTFKLETFDKKVVKVTMGRKPEEKKIKPPSATADGKSGPAALGSIADLAKKSSDAKPGDEKKDDKPIGPEFETIPAGPVFVSVDHSDGAAAINSLMQKRAFQIADYTFTGLPQKSDELFEPAPVPAPPVAAPTAPDKPAAPPK
jgi:Domain of unknown function (DUF4340)